MFLSFFIALIGCLVTGTQSVLIYLQGEGVCFNEGCTIVDSLTRVDPLYFNLAGFVFFLVAAIGLSSARKGSDLSKRFISLILLAALAAEGVLFAFQVIISEAFCSYCLIILSLIALMNLFMGLKQFFKAGVIFSAVLLASFVLDYHGGRIKPQPLENGTMALVAGAESETELFLFISSTCEHCKKVLESLDDGQTCTIKFNPIDRLDTLPLDGVEKTASYDPDINLAFLKRLEIQEIPVLLSRSESSMTLITGERAIQAYIDEQCRPQLKGVIGTSSIEMTSSYQPPLPIADDGCTIEEACEDPQGATSEQSPISIQ